MATKLTQRKMHFETSAVTYIDWDGKIHNAIINHSIGPNSEITPYRIGIVYVKFLGYQKGYETVETETDLMSLEQWKESGYDSAAIDDMYNPEEVRSWREQEELLDITKQETISGNGSG